MNPEIRQKIEQIKNGKVPDGYHYSRAGLSPNDWGKGSLSDVLYNEQRAIQKPNEGYWRIGIRSHAKGTFHEYVENPEAVDMDELYVVRENDLILNITFAWEHAVALADKDDDGLLVSHRFPTYVFREGQNPIFYKSVAVQKRFKEMLGLISPGGAGRNRVMSKKDFLRLPCNIPPFVEQQKIAEILMQCDKVIELKQKHFEEEKKLKIALMQKLLNPDSVIRLSGFKGEWKEVRLRDCCISNGKYGLNAPSCEFSETLPRYLRITDIDDNGKYTSANEVSVDCEEWQDYTLRDGDLLFVRTGGTVGKVYKYRIEDGNLVYAGFLIKFSVDTTQYDSTFIYAQFGLHKYEKWIKTMSARSGQPGINAEEYADYKFYVPPIEEQKAISKIITSSEERIDLLQKDLEQWQQKKKSLMQLLLTGIVRVQV